MNETRIGKAPDQISPQQVAGLAIARVWEVVPGQNDIGPVWQYSGVWRSADKPVRADFNS